jgi:hypothetical protein
MVAGRERDMQSLLKFQTAAAIALALLSVPANAQGVTFRNTEFKFRFVYPNDWSEKKPRGPNVRALIQGPPGRMSNCNIVVRRVPALEKASRKEIIADSFSTTWSETDWKEMFGDKFSNATIRERRLTKASNYPAQFSIAETRYETVAANIHAVMMQFVTITPGLFWHFACLAGGATPEQARQQFQQMRPQFLSILSSFVFEEGFY